MKRFSVPTLAAGLVLLAAAGWLAWGPPRVPRPSLPEVTLFAGGERIALVMSNPGDFFDPAGLGLAQRARAAGAEARAFATPEAAAGFGPDRAYRVWTRPHLPTGYHPDLWPDAPADLPGGAQMLVLTPAETAVRNQAVLEAARAIRAGGADDAPGTREAQMLARARRAEFYMPLPP